jgi:hypothetical protein
VSRQHRRVVVSSVALVVGLMVFGAGVTPAFADCSQGERNSGECRSIDASAGDDEVTVRVDTGTPGSPGSPGRDGGSGGEQAGSPPPPPAPPPGRTTPAPPRNPVLGSDDCQVVIGGRCRAPSPPKNPPQVSAPVPTPSTPPIPPTPPRFARELGSYRPDAPGVTIQPGEWSMPRLPTNFIASARTHTRSGELAGWPIEVRFVPHRYHWSFGDGTRATWSEAGKSWAAWGKQQFDPTPTSHIYATPGVYSVSLLVEYRVWFRFVGQSFQRLDGTVSASSGSYRLRVLTVSPLLVG